MSVYSAETVFTSPGARSPTVIEEGAVNGSDTVTPVSGTLPVFETWKSKVTTSPAETLPSPFVSAGAACDFWTSIAGVCFVGVVAVALEVGGTSGTPGVAVGMSVWPGVGLGYTLGVGVSPVTVASLMTMPLSRSACVIVYVAKTVLASPGFNTPTDIVFDERPGIGSVTVTFVIVTVPVFSTLKK